MVFVTETPWTIRESSRDAQGPSPIEVARGNRLSHDRSGDRIDWDVPVAKAALQLVAAYRHLHEVDPQTLPPWAIASFRAVCNSLCSTVVVMDHLTADLWGPEPA
jgi:hypothetical protein